MYKKGKYVLVIGAVVVVLLMVSSACAVNVVQSSNVKNSLESESSEVYVDPDLFLTEKYLPLFEKALPHINTVDYQKLVENIIVLLRNKKQIDSEDVKTLVNNLDIDVSKIYFSRIFYAYGFGGRITCFPGTIMCKLLFPFVYIGPVLFGAWDLESYSGMKASFQIGIFGEPIKMDRCSGIALGGFALPFYNFNFIGIRNGAPDFCAGGFFTLIILS